MQVLRFGAAYIRNLTVYDAIMIYQMKEKSRNSWLCGKKHIGAILCFILVSIRP